MSSAPPARVSWLHLSDFHLRVKTGWAQDQVLSTMLDDIRARYSGAKAPDLLFLTGDIAFSGKTDEYSLAKDFIQKLCATTDVSRDRLCIIPGNHDIDLEKEEDAVVGARLSLTDTPRVDRFFGNEGRRATLFARQRAFRDFVNQVSPPASPVYTPSSFAHSRTLQIGAVRVRVLLLDSAWLAVGGTSDVSELLVGERQVLECGPPDDGCLTIALLHHPFGWLRQFEQLSIENLVMRCAQICLRGHVHTSDLRTIDGRLGSLTMFTAGAAFESRTADNSYLYCSIDLTTGAGEKVVHRYNHQQHCWDAGESEAWTIGASTLPGPDVGSVHRALTGANMPYPSYVACLVSGLQTDVPIALSYNKCAFVGYGVAIPGVQNKCGDIVQKLRNHFYWKRVWDAESWGDHLLDLSNELAEAFRVLDSLAGEEVRGHESTSADLINAFTGNLGATSPACDEIESLLAQHNLEHARVVFDRWFGQDILRAHEAARLRRLEILLLISEERPGDALICAEVLVQSTDRTCHDLALAARSAFDAGEFARASIFMHSALDMNVPLNEVRTMALRIAGAVGDNTLTKRVLR